MSDYTPIDCGIHDHLELTAMRRVPVAVEFVDADGSRAALSGVRLLTIRATEGAEYGVFDDGDGVRREIRLDRIATVHVPGGRLEVGGACASVGISAPPVGRGSAPPAPSTPPASRPG
jgi:transcriptional antiterminator Rof (Rho-off)